MNTSFKGSINLSYLERRSTSQSFGRGRAYYHEGRVKEVRLTTGTYEAKVHGSGGVYQVTIQPTEEGFELKCSCPYSFGGICKHAVAVGIAVANNEFKKCAPPAVRALNSMASLEQFKQTVFQQATRAQKVDFLLGLFDKDNALRHQFAAYVQNGQQEVAFANIDEICKEVFNRLSSLDFSERDLEAYDDYSYHEYLDQ